MVLLYFLAAWIFLILASWECWSMVQLGVRMTRQMHRIPCSSCMFFTGDYFLKCTVHPSEALTEEAIACRDYCSRVRYGA
ncbi:MAG: hypothetical protein MUF49_18195 [Oculatellaceae cyanobacterium Prado106]|nr:hypothetical protein [Oculatellaceae cyanobacterium Prado106]